MVCEMMGKRTTTNSIELHNIANHLLPGFAGVYAADGTPQLSKSTPYAIINTKPAHTGGEHWVALCWTLDGLLHYDSYGRSHASLFPGKSKGAKNTDPDVEQGDRATKCGQRCIAWLLCCQLLGSELAKKI